MKTFNRNKNIDQGKHGELIERIALQYFKHPDHICDLLCFKDSEDGYILLVLSTRSFDEQKLESYINQFVPFNIIVLYHKCTD
jgi:hypothetical protein